MVSVSSSSSTPMLDWPFEEAMYNYSLNHGFYDHSEQELATPVTGFIDHPGNFAPARDQTMGRNGDAKKVNHNASERHRRKKINELYSSLRTLLPASEQSRRMSIPTTVAKVLKYIPELQEEVEKMEKKRQAMSKKIHHNQGSVTSPSSKQTTSEHYKQDVNEGPKGNIIQEKSYLSHVSTSKVADREVVIQVSSLRISLPEILMNLEEDGFQLIGAFSSSESFGGMVFLNLHLQKAFRIEKTECEGLDQKLLSMLENKWIVSRHL